MIYERSLTVLIVDDQRGFAFVTLSNVLFAVNRFYQEVKN